MSHPKCHARFIVREDNESEFRPKTVSLARPVRHARTMATYCIVIVEKVKHGKSKRKSDQDLVLFAVTGRHLHMVFLEFSL
jgi:hypothetical protein